MKATEAEIHKLDGNAALQAGDGVRALNPYTKAIALTPNDHTLYSNRAFAFTKTKEYSRALADADKCVQLNPKWAKGHFRRGEALRLMGVHAQALLAYQKASSLDPEDDHLTKCKREAAASAAEDERFAQQLVYVGLGVAAVLACLIALTGAHLCFLSAVVVLALGFPGGKAASMLWEHHRDGRMATPSTSNTDFIRRQFPGIQLHQSDKDKKAARAEEAAIGGPGKARTKTNTREAAMRSRGVK